MHDFALNLPSEISQQIFSNLTLPDLLTASLCSRNWRELVNSNRIWERICQIRGFSVFAKNPNLLDLNSHQSVLKSASNVSGTSPLFTAPWDCPSLSPPCEWKEIFIRSRHLMTNWKEGRYSVTVLPRGHKEKVAAMASNGTIVVTGGADHKLIIWDVESEQKLFTLSCHTDSVTSLVLQGDLIVTGCADCFLRLIDANEGRLLAELRGHRSGIERVCIDGDWILSCSSDRMIYAWSLRWRELKHVMRGHTDEIECLEISGSHAVSGGWDHRLILWDLQTGSEIHTYWGHAEAVTCAKLFPSRRCVVSGSADTSLRVWTTDTPDEMHILVGHSAEVYCVASHDDILASGSADSTVRLWTFKGKPLHVFRGHLGVIRCLYMDEFHLISGGDQKMVIVWDYKRKKTLQRLHRHPSLLHLLWADRTKIITASPSRPGAITLLSFW